MPDAITPEDWITWNRGAAVLARLKTLLTEARPGISGIAPGLTPNYRWGSDERWIYSGYASERLELGVGFSANESARRPDSDPIVWTYVHNREHPAGEERARAEEACRVVPGAERLWTSYPYVKRRAAEVLTAADFREQIKQVVRFASSVALAFQRAGYLPGDLPIAPPPT